MTPLVRRYVKTSFVFLLMGLLVGARISWRSSSSAPIPPPRHHRSRALLLVGFLLMIVMGVATWMFPRPARADTRYRPELAEAVYWVMTTATALRTLGERAASLVPSPALRALIAAGGLGQLAGAGLFVVNMWWRVRMPVAAPPSAR